MSEPTQKEIFWRDLELSARLYQFYIDAALKVNLFSYGITGGIVSFCLSKAQSDYTSWALLLPILMSISLAILFGYSSTLAKVFADDAANLSEKLRLLSLHDFGPLVFSLRVFCVLHLCTAVGLAYLLWKLAA